MKIDIKFLIKIPTFIQIKFSICWERRKTYNTLIIHFFFNLCEISFSFFKRIHSWKRIHLKSFFIYFKFLKNHLFFQIIVVEILQKMLFSTFNDWSKFYKLYPACVNQVLIFLYENQKWWFFDFFNITHFQWVILKIIT